MIGNPIGTYGTDYTARASIAYFGLGANLLKDAFYPSITTGPNGKSLDCGQHSVIHFNKDQLPPVRAFWSVTLHNDKQFLSANPINRYALGDRDKLHFNKDGSLDIYIQWESPGKDKESNWLPAPASGTFSLVMRFYWPEPQAFDGTWSPPPLAPIVTLEQPDANSAQEARGSAVASLAASDVRESVNRRLRAAVRNLPCPRMYRFQSLAAAALFTSGPKVS